MLRHSSKMGNYSIEASDGAIGSVTDFLFDDSTWLIRWMVIETGGWLSGRKVLLPPSALGAINHIDRQISVRLTQQQIKESPGIDTDKPLSRQMETGLYDYFGWAPYWSTTFFMGGYGYTGGMMEPPGPGFEDARQASAAAEIGDPSLRSIHAITGYHLYASDGAIGHITDFLVEDADWSIHYLVVDTRDWWPGKKVLISPRSIVVAEWHDRTVHLNIDRQQVKGAPAYDGSETLDRAYENAFHRHYDGKPLVQRAETLSAERAT